MRAIPPTPVDSERLTHQTRGQFRGAWLSCYPTFNLALQHAETDLRALPPYAKLPILKRMTCAQPCSSASINDVRVAYVEISTACVVEAVERYLTSGMRSEEKEIEPGLSASLETVAAQFAPTAIPLVARPPCLLSPGKGIFLEGWARFFAYWSRRDKTIPLLAVDWPVLYERLTSCASQGRETAADTQR
ncbi:hypothetical protein C9I57_08625 [Trinickia symbiotica]|uniref:Uncharacterized protein n=1 Tax=Trinickia symbiotica TaxID=863227 RepID=A0A2T3XWE5_9BURK|nr:hypothetical protein C9I57_08625 [Trinickia symbiotica]